MRVFRGTMFTFAMLLTVAGFAAGSFVYSPPVQAQQCPPPPNPGLDECLEDAATTWDGDQQFCDAMRASNYYDVDEWRKCREDARWRYLDIREECYENNPYS